MNTGTNMDTTANTTDTHIFKIQLEKNKNEMKRWKMS